MLNSKESLGEKFVKRGLWLYFFSFLIGPLGYFVKIILSQDLSVSEIGILYGIISLISLLSVYHDLGLTEALNYFLPKFIVEKNYQKFKSVLAYTMLAQIPTSIIVASILYFGANYLSIHYFKDPISKNSIQILSLFFIGMNFFSIMGTVFNATQNTKYQKGVEFIRMIAILAFVFYFFITGKGSLEAYAWNWIFGIVVGIIFSGILFYKKYYVEYLKGVKIIYDKKLFKDLFGYALWVLLAANVGTVLGQIDMQLIIYMLGTTDAGYYTNYLSIIGIPFIIITPIIGFLFPVVSELSSGNNNDKITTIKTMFYKYFGTAGIIVSVFMFVFSSELAIVFFGEKFAKSGEIMAYSIFFLIFNFLLQINFQILAGVGKIKYRVKILAIGLVFNFILNLALIPILGVDGSSLAVGLSWIPIFYLSHRATSMYFDGFDWKFFFKNFFASSLLGVIMFFYTKTLLIGKPRFEILFFILLFGFLYIIPLFLINLSEWKLFWGEIKKMRK